MNDEHACTARGSDGRKKFGASAKRKAIEKNHYSRRKLLQLRRCAGRALELHAVLFLFLFTLVARFATNCAEANPESAGADSHWQHTCFAHRAELRVVHARSRRDLVHNVRFPAFKYRFALRGTAAAARVNARLAASSNLRSELLVDFRRHVEVGDRAAAERARELHVLLLRALADRRVALQSPGD